MKMHAWVIIPAITLALLLGTAEPGKAREPHKGARDLAQLMPADALVYAEMSHPRMARECLALIQNSALNDYAGFRDDLYRRLKLEVVGEERFRASGLLALCLTPEFLDEFGRINGFAVALTSVKEGRIGPETSFVWVIDPGPTNLVPLITREILTLDSSMKSVRTVEGVRLYQSFQMDRRIQRARTGIREVETAANQYLRNDKKLTSLEDLHRSNTGNMPYLKRKSDLIDPWGKPYQFAVKADRATVWSDSPLGKITLNSRPEKIVPEPVGPVLAAMPGLVVVGSDADVVADVIRRDRGKRETTTAPALADLPDFQQFAEVRKKQQLFGFASLGKMKSMLQANPGLAAVVDLEGLMGADSGKGLAVAFWLDQSSPRMDLTVKLGSKTPGPLVQLLSSRPIDPRVLHFVPDNAVVSMTLPLPREPGAYDRLLATIRKVGERFRQAGRDQSHVHRHITPDGRRLVTPTREGIDLWDVESGKVLRALPVAGVEKGESWLPRLRNLTISADGKQIVTVEEAGERRESLVVTVREAETGKQMRFGKMDYYPDLAVSADGKRLACAADSGKLMVVATADPGKTLYTLEPEPRIDDRVIAMSFSPDGKQLACSYRNGGISVWTMGTKAQSHRIDVHGQPVATMSFSPDGKYLAAGYDVAFEDRREPFSLALVKVFDVALGNEVLAIEAQPGTVTGISFAPGGKRLLVATDTHSRFGGKIAKWDASIKVWDLDKNKNVLTLHGNAAITMAVAADGKRIVAADRTGRIQVWDARNGTEVLVLSESSFDVQLRRIAEAVASPQNKELATSGRSVTGATIYNPDAGPGEPWAEGMLILEMKDEAAAKAAMDMLPDVLGKGQKARTRQLGKHTIHTLIVGRTLFEDPLGLGTLWFYGGEQSYGREGNVLVFAPSAKTVARALQGGAARSGFATQPDVAQTLSQVQEVNGLILWSGRNLIRGWLRSQEIELQAMTQSAGKPHVEKLAEGKPWPNLERDLFLRYPQQLAKITADVNKVTQDLPAGSLIVTARTDRLTVSGGQRGLQTVIPRLIDALVEWDLSRPQLGRHHPGAFPVEPDLAIPGRPPEPDLAIPRETPLRQPPRKEDPKLPEAPGPR